MMAPATMSPMATTTRAQRRYRRRDHAAAAAEANDDDDDEDDGDDDDDDPRASRPLLEKGGRGDVGGTRRRLGSSNGGGASGAHDNALALGRQVQDKIYASSFDPPPLPRRHLPPQSLTPGGYGPVSPNSFDDPDHNDAWAKYAKGRKLHNRLLSSLSSFLRQAGCSGDAMRSEEGPNGSYYRDDFNDESWNCDPGTGEENGIWMNTRDQAGTVMAAMVWFLLAYSAVTVALLAETGGIPSFLAAAYSVLCSLALASHAKTTFTDPGSVPQSAVPVESMRREQPEQQLSMCSQCQTFKPPFSHHCRICNRCISRMDHHCPWMNNCIGAANLKHFILFLAYTWSCSALSLLLLGWNYFFCADEECEFTHVLVQLVRVMTVLSVGSFLFTSSMIMNVSYGLLTGIGTIDRLKKKATNTMHESTEEPIPLSNVFGIAGLHTWPLPIDPVFPDYDQVMGYSTPQRLLREQMKEERVGGAPAMGGVGGGGDYAASVISKASFLPPASEQNFYGPV